MIFFYYESKFKITFFGRAGARVTDFFFNKSKSKKKNGGGGVLGVWAGAKSSDFFQSIQI